MMKTKIALDIDLLEELLATRDPLPLYPRGTSMLPLIREGRDLVFLTKPKETAPGDIVLVRDGAQARLHRLLSKKDGRIVTCGDNCTVPDPTASEAQIVAKAAALCRDGILYEEKRLPARLYRLWHTHFSKIHRGYLRLLLHFRLARGFRRCPCCGYVSRFQVSEEDAWDDRPMMKEKMLLPGRRCICPVCGSMPYHRILAWYFSRNGFPAGTQRIVSISSFPPLARWLNSLSVPWRDLPLSILCEEKAELPISSETIFRQSPPPDILFCIHRLEDTPDVPQALSRLVSLMGEKTLLVLAVTHLDDPALVAEKNRKFAILGNGIFSLLKKEGLSCRRIDVANAPKEIDPLPGPAVYDGGPILLCRKRTRRKVRPSSPAAPARQA